MTAFLKWFSRLKYGQKLLITYMVVAVIPLSLFGFLAYHLSNDYLKERVISGVSDSSGKIAYIIKQKADQYNNIAYLAMSDDRFLQIVSGNGGELLRADDISSYFNSMDWSINTLQDKLTDVRVYAMHCPTENDVLSSFSSQKQKEYSGMQDHASLWKKSGTDIVFARRIIDPYTQSLLGILEIKIDSESFFERYMDLNYPQYGIIVVDHQGDPVFTMKHFDDISGRTPEDLIEKSTEPILQYHGKKYIIGKGMVDAADWTVICYVPYSIISGRTYKIVKLTVQIGAICLLAILGISFALSKSLVKRLQALMYQMQRVKRGELSVTMPKGPDDEIGRLCEIFGNMVESIARLIKDVYQSKVQQKEAELKALQAQINPHFLYNCLSVVNFRALMLDDIRISNVVTNLSEFYRTALNKGRSIISVRDELINVKAYLDIQLELHDNSFDVFYDINPEVLEYGAVNLTLQPIVENAIEHGIDKCPSERGNIRLSAAIDGTDVVFNILNSGKPIDSDQAEKVVTNESGGYGLCNVNDRIKLTYGEQYGVEIYPVQEGTECKVRIPAKVYWGEKYAK